MKVPRDVVLVGGRRLTLRSYVLVSTVVLNRLYIHVQDRLYMHAQPCSFEFLVPSRDYITVVTTYDILNRVMTTYNVDTICEGAAGRGAGGRAPPFAAELRAGFNCYFS